MPRYALLLSGQARYNDYVIRNLVQNLILPNQCDVFGYFWGYEDNFIDKYVWDVPNKDVVRRDIHVMTYWRQNLERMVQQIPFTKLEVVKQIDFPLNRFGPGEKEKDGALTLGEKVFQDSVERWNFSIHCQFHSIWAANQLRKKYEEEKGFVYDGVFRLRTDILMENPISLDKLDATKLHLSLKKDPSKRTHYDYIAYGNSSLMDIYCDYIHHLDWVYSFPYDELHCSEVHLLKYLDAFIPDAPNTIQDYHFEVPSGLRIIY